MRREKMRHAIGKAMASAQRVVGEYLKTIEDRFELFFSPHFSEYASIEVRREGPKNPS